MKHRILSIFIAVLLLTACAATSQETAMASTAAATAAATASQSGRENETIQALNDPADETKITTDIFSITSDEGEITPDGTVYMITEAGEYTVSGLLTDGQIVVDAGDDADVKLNLNDASISCSTGAPILIISASEVTIKAEKNTYNTVTDLRSGVAEEAEDDAAIYAACDLKLSGSGTLIVSSAFDNGIKSKDDLSIKNLTLKVTAYGNALKGNDSVSIKSGEVILISTASDGIKTENSDISSKGKQRGTVSIEGGQVDIYAACDGISAAYNVEISEGDTSAIVNIYTAAFADAENVSAGTEKYLIVPVSLYSDSYTYAAYFYNDDETAGIWAICTYETMVYSGRTAAYYGLVFRAPNGYQNVLFEILNSGATPDGSNYLAATGGDTLNGSMNGFLIYSVTGDTISGDWVNVGSGSGSSSKTTYSSKGIKAENEILISGGTIAIFASDDGIHANGGDMLENGTEGSGNVTISGGAVSVTASDDGIHADGELTVNGGSIDVKESHEGLEANVITLNGGSVYVYADDDGLNACKGNVSPMIYINGGYVQVQTPSGDTDAIDSNGSFKMTGGIALVLSGAQMGGMAGSVDVDGSVTVTGGTIVALGGICQIPSGGSVNTYVSSGTNFSAGAYKLTDKSGKTILTFTLDTGYSSCWIASDAFALNGSYVLEKDGSTILSWTQSSSTEGTSGNYNNYGGFGYGGFGGRR